MAHAIRSLGMESYLIGIQDRTSFKAAAYAYLRGDIPCILGFALFDCSGESGNTYEQNIDHKFCGLHAVALTGYNLPGIEEKPYTPDPILPLAAHRMDKIYVHDDGVGPFARMEFDDRVVNAIEDGKKVRCESLTTYWKKCSGGGEPGSCRAVLGHLLIPLYPKIRIPLDYIIHQVESFHRRVDEMCNLSSNRILEWDVYISRLNPFKEELITKKQLHGPALHKLLTTTLPRFLWRAKLLFDQVLQCELLFDATDFQDGNTFLCGIDYNGGFFYFLSSTIRDAKNDTQDYYEDLMASPAATIFKWIEQENAEELQ
ncbi:MAG: hypothetical protein HQL56_05690 [Magnetococcales bacterium]|nr:hypothetical protein [Magnetococcales bacterium]